MGVVGPKSGEVISGISAPERWRGSFHGKRVGLVDYAHDDPWLYMDGNVLSLHPDDGDPARDGLAQTLPASEVPHWTRHDLLWCLLNSRTSL